MLATSAVASLPKLPPVRRGGNCIEENVATASKFSRGLQTVNNSISLSRTQFPFDRRTPSTRAATIICAGALDARCGGAEQTQTVLRESPTITHLPGKEKSPQIDDGGSGFPPRDDDDGGGGGGGGGNWGGGFFFFGFLAFLGFLKDRETEDGGYSNRRRR